MIADRQLDGPATLGACASGHTDVACRHARSRWPEGSPSYAGPESRAEMAVRLRVRNQPMVSRANRAVMKAASGISPREDVQDSVVTVHAAVAAAQSESDVDDEGGALAHGVHRDRADRRASGLDRVARDS